MAVTFKCKGCDKEKPINPRLKGNQKYCGNPDCQRARRSKRQANRMATDPDYYKAQRELVQHWQKNKPVSRYMTDYRNSNTAYVKKNRIKQGVRNRKRSCGSSDSMAPKKDAFTKKPQTYAAIILIEDHAETIIEMGTFYAQVKLYKGNPTIHQKLPCIELIVKMDTLSQNINATRDIPLGRLKIF